MVSEKKIVKHKKNNVNISGFYIRHCGPRKTKNSLPNQTFVHFSASTFLEPYLHQFFGAIGQIQYQIYKIDAETAPSIMVLFGTNLVSNISTKA